MRRAPSPSLFERVLCGLAGRAAVESQICIRGWGRQGKSRMEAGFLGGRNRGWLTAAFMLSLFCSSRTQQRAARRRRAISTAGEPLLFNNVKPSNPDEIHFEPPRSILNLRIRWVEKRQVARDMKPIHNARSTREQPWRQCTRMREQ